nr:MAG TPA: hypothetical protein [Crassvirales sp.]
MRTKWEYFRSKGRGTNNTLVLLFFYNLLLSGIKLRNYGICS